MGRLGGFLQIGLVAIVADIRQGIMPLLMAVMVPAMVSATVVSKVLHSFVFPMVRAINGSCRPSRLDRQQHQQQTEYKASQHVPVLYLVRPFAASEQVPVHPANIPP